MTTRIARHASKKASTSINPNYKSYSLNNFTETEFDQTTNYSLLYAEENSVVEEVGHFDYLLAHSEQENTLTTYYTEGTPFETPPHFSTSTSTSDLLKLDDLKLNSILQVESKIVSVIQTADNHKDKPDKPKVTDKLRSYMEFENKDKQCEDSDDEIYLPDDSDDFDDKSDEHRLERIINVTPSQSPVELCDRDKEGKMVTFGGEDRYSEQTPLMFSRCSSLGSLSGYEQLHDDRSSIVSDFSRRTSEVVSPSELPDSPAQFVHPGQQRDKRLSRKKLQPAREKSQPPESLASQQEASKASIFEDDLAVFKEESTPVKFQSVAASSLSSLTIDDEDDVYEHGDGRSKAAIIKSPKAPATIQQCSGPVEKKRSSGNAEAPEESSYLPGEEEKILDEYIRKGIAKVTKQHINDVSSFSLRANNAYDSDTEKSCENACKSSCSADGLDESSDLTAEEERLLDECIRRGIAKVTRQNINDVTSLSLRPDFPRQKACEAKEKQDKEQQKHEEGKKRTTLCQTE